MLAFWLGPAFCFAHGCQVGVQPLGVTFDLYHAPLLAWQRLVQLVNEVVDPGGMAGTVWLEERLLIVCR